mgnify:CR=1 FL=1
MSVRCKNYHVCLPFFVILKENIYIFKINFSSGVTKFLLKNIFIFIGKIVNTYLQISILYFKFIV